MEKHKELLLRLLRHHFTFDEDADELDWGYNDSAWFKDIDLKLHNELLKIYKVEVKERIRLRK